MDFRTEIAIPPSGFKISHKTKILTAGSCFAEVIGDKLTENKFQALVNPFGTIFNPISLFKLLNASISNSYLHQDYFVHNNDIWYNYDFHSSLSSPYKNELHDKIRKKTTEVHYFLKNADVITITFGTAYVYKLLPDMEVVANCHKRPSTLFRKELLSTTEIEESFKAFYSQLKELNPDCKIILTLSPVRHTKDTLVLNNVSKSILRLAIHNICEKHHISYFPAYEIMMDDLRDYRYYKEDMIHPSVVAEKYIWQKFLGCYTDPSTQSILEKWNILFRALHHRPFNENSTAHLQFLKDTLFKLKSLSSELEVSKELQELEERIRKIETNQN